MLQQRVKPLERILAEAGDDTKPGTLKKTLGPISLTAIGIGAIIGTGIFVLTGVAAATRSGPSLTVSFIVAGIVSALAALCYAEVASRIPIAGSSYTFAYASLGEFVAWIVGWDLILEYAVASSTVSIGWSGYFTTFIKNVFGIVIPSAFQHNYFDVSPTGEPIHGIMNLPAFVIVCLVGALLYRGTRDSAIVNNVIVTVKLLIVFFFIAMGLGHVNTGNWVPYFPFGVSGMFGGAAFCFFAYIGFDTVTTGAEEAKNPKRDVPIGILASLVVCTILYIIVVAILTGMVPYTKLNVPSPVAFAMDQVGLGWASAIISVGAIAGLTTVLLTQMFGQTRIFFAMARDRLLPSSFSRIHPRFRTPSTITVITTLFIATVGSLTPIDFVGSLTSMGTLAAFVLVSIALPILRKRYPDRGGFEIPFGPYIIPVLSALGALGLMFSLAFGSPKFLGIPLPWFAFVVWMLIGLIVYFTYSRRKSMVGNSEGESAA